LPPGHAPLLTRHGDPLRKAITLILYLAMIGIEWLALGSRGIIFKAGGFLALFGLYFL
jgi:hypothetical protein